MDGVVNRAFSGLVQRDFSILFIFTKVIKMSPQALAVFDYGNWRLFERSISEY